MFWEWLILGLGASITSMGALGDETLWGSDFNASLGRHIQVYFAVGILSASIFAALGGAGWIVWKGLHPAGYSGEWTVTVAALITVPVVLIGFIMGWWHILNGARPGQNRNRLIREG